MLLAWFSAMRFLLWRIFFTLNLTSPANTITSLLLLYAEIFAVIVLSLICVQNWYLDPREEPPEPDEDFEPQVDVFICTYNESLEIVRRTVCGAKALNYPNKKVYLLDDGRRDYMSQLALDLGVEYITRPDNRNAKSGNINNALKQAKGDLVLILDADHIPCRTLLDKTVPYFSDPLVAIVQTPHRFMNAAPIQRNLYLEGVLPHEQEMFFQISMVGKDYWNAAIFAGSVGLIRRSVIDEMGGMSILTVIEDCEFSLSVHRKGYRTVYIPEALSIGLCPESLSAYLTQQSRWAKGQTQMLMLTNPLGGPGLSMAQRICYLSGNIHYLFGLARLIFLILPTFFLVFGTCATSVSWLKYLIYMGPFAILYLLAQHYTFRNFRHSFWADVYEVVLAPYTLYWTFATLIDPEAPRFDVTPKGLKQERYHFSLKLVWYHWLILLWCILSLIIGTLKGLFGFDPSGNFANVVLTLYNIFILVCAIFVGFERPQMRRVHRVRRRLPVTIDVTDFSNKPIAAWSEDASEYGIRLVLEETPLKFETGNKLNLTIQSELKEIFNVDGKVVRARFLEGRWTLEVEFDKNMSLDLRERLIVEFYCSPETWAMLVEPGDSILSSFISLIGTPARVFKSLQQQLPSKTIPIDVPERFKNLLPKQIPIHLGLKQDGTGTIEKTARDQDDLD